MIHFDLDSKAQAKHIDYLKESILVFALFPQKGKIISNISVHCPGVVLLESVPVAEEFFSNPFQGFYQNEIFHTSTFIRYPEYNESNLIF